VYLYILNSFLVLEKAHGPPQKSLQKRVEKTYPFWTKTYLIWKVGGGGGKGTDGLNQKNLPRVVFKFPVPPWWEAEHVDGSGNQSYKVELDWWKILDGISISA
jgi:hypothetical protein